MEARLRQLEGKVLATGSAALGQKANQAAYDPKMNGASAAIATTSKAYNPAADVPANGDAKVKKEKVHFHTGTAFQRYSSESGSPRTTCPSMDGHQGWCQLFNRLCTYQAHKKAPWYATA